METEDSLYTRVLEAAGARRWSDHTLKAYGRTWLRVVAQAAAESVELITLPPDIAREWYAQWTRGRSPSHHLQVKAALGFLYEVLGSRNPFEDCSAPKFDAAKIELRYLSPAQTAQLLVAMGENRHSYFDHLAFHLATALFFTACRFHEWALLPVECLVRSGDAFVGASLQIKGGKFRELPIAPALSNSLREWLEFLDGIRGVRLRGGAIGFAGSPLVFPGRDGGPVSNQAFNQRLDRVCRNAGLPVITAHGLRHSAATLLLNDRSRNLREIQAVLGHKNLSTTARYTHVERERLRSIFEEIRM